MIARVKQDENPELFEILKTYATSRGAAIDGDELLVTGEWAEFRASGQLHRVFSIGFRYRTTPDDVPIHVSVVKNLTVIRPEGTT